ncbi:MAG: translation initiation factor IF-2 [Armatimonadetes bacterium]|nr:translation initiation factor IF-2 [Armatimonadota bacterium]
MARVRIYQLAKEIDISSKEMMDTLVEIGMDVKSPSSTIEESMADTIKEMVEERRAKEAAALEAAKPQPAPEPEPKPEPEIPPARPATTAAAPPAVAKPVEVAWRPEPEPAVVPPVLAPPAPPTTQAPRRQSKKERKTEALRSRRERPAPRAHREKEPQSQEDELYVPGEHRTVKIPTTVTVRELAQQTGVSTSQLISKLLASKILRSVNQSISSDVASQILEGFNISVEVDRRRIRSEELTDEEKSNLVSVAPVVTIMGHVDHGKTTLLDNIRKSNVAATEAGQITQRIGAYEVEVHGKRIVFLDTPGHEAFTMMRARGAHVTDIAILVVAADDGVMPQTLEAIDHARAASVPILVALNKIDKPEANSDHVKHQLSEVGLIPEDWGGETVFMPVSAKLGNGIEELLQMILLVAEMEDLRANPKAKSRGVVIEAHLDPQRGPVATVLVQQGTFRTGDYVVAGSTCGRIRAMCNYRGETLSKAGPAIPATLIGFDTAPHASDIVRVVADGKIARMRADEYAAESRSGSMAGFQRVTLEDLFAQIQKGEVKDLNIIVKADVQGSVEALCQALLRLEHEEVRLKIIHRGVGNINESDIMLASASNAIVLGFSVSVEGAAQALAERERIDVRTYEIIYDVLNNVKAAMLGMLEPVFEEKLLGEAEVRALFKSSRAGVIAGCMVTNGSVRRNTRVKVLRNQKIVHEGNLDSLRHLRDDVTEIAAGMECGITLNDFNDLREGDVVQSFVMEEVPRTLTDMRMGDRTRTEYSPQRS